MSGRTFLALRAYAEMPDLRVVEVTAGELREMLAAVDGLAAAQADLAKARGEREAALDASRAALVAAMAAGEFACDRLKECRASEAAAVRRAEVALKIIKGQDALLAAYRTGRPPSSRVLDGLRRDRDALRALGAAVDGEVSRGLLRILRPVPGSQSLVSEAGQPRSRAATAARRRPGRGRAGQGRTGGGYGPR